MSATGGKQQQRQQQSSVFKTLADTLRMPRFYFHLYDDEVVLDGEGRDLPSAALATEVAIRDARELACAEVLEGHLGLNHRIEVTDANDAPIATVHFRDVVKIHP